MEVGVTNNAVDIFDNKLIYDKTERLADKCIALLVYQKFREKVLN